MTLARTALVGLALTFAASPALADDAAKRGEALVKGLKLDSKLFGTYWMGVHYNGAKNIGHMKMKVESSPPGGAGYWITTDVAFRFGPMSQTIAEKSHLAESMARVSATSTKVESQGGAKVRTKQTFKRADGKWTRTQERDGKSRSVSVADGLDYWEVAQRLMLARKLPRDKPGTYKLRGIKWPSFAAGEGAAAEWRTITITVPKATTYNHRGKPVQAHLIQFQMERDEDEVVAVDTKGNVLALWPKKTPIKLVAAATEAEAKADIKSKADSPDVKAVKAAVKVYFEVVFKVKKAEALDKVLDWAALKDNLVKLQPSLADQTAEEFAAQTKKELSSVEVDPEGKAILGLLDSILKVKVEGDTAKVTMNDETKISFELKKQKDGAWKMVRVPLGE